MKFRILIKGENFLTALGSSTARKHGFFVTAQVDGESEEAAEKQAFVLLRADEELRKRVQNSSDDRPRLSVEKIIPIEATSIDDPRPFTGFAWYREEND